MKLKSFVLLFVHTSIALTTNIPTETFLPQAIHVDAEKLPPPFATDSARKPPRLVPIPESPRLRVPKGFKVNVFAEDLNSPRWLALTPAGDVLVTETRLNRVVILSDKDGDGVAERKSVFANETSRLNIPFGMCFVPRDAKGENFFFYLGNTDSVIRYRYKKNDTSLKGSKGQKITYLPGGGYNQHWTRNVIPAANNSHLFVSVGSESNADLEPIPRASIQVLSLDGSKKYTLASGLRNPVGMATHPVTQELYTTVNERDGLGDDLVPDYLTRVLPGEFYGWPLAYLSPDYLDPRHLDANGNSTNPSLVAQTLTPDVLFQAHSAALGLQFYDKDQFPMRYRNGTFVAFRGSWNRNSGTGYKIVHVPFNHTTNRPLGYYEDFVTGFLIDPKGPTTWGRPVGILVMPDGSLLFTEEGNHRIYRVTYSPD